MSKRTQDEQTNIYVGKKPLPNYVLAVISAFEHGADEVHIKARGLSISRAVDVEQIVRTTFVTSLKSRIKTSTEIRHTDNNIAKVSTIDIKLVINE